jgi:spermidine synthase
MVNGVPSSYLDLDDPGFLAFEYMQQMAAFVDCLPPGPLRVVHLGAAGCTFARWMEHARPGSTQLAIDLDTELVTLVRDWFDLPRSPRLRLRPGDARRELATVRTGWADVVVRDVFAPDVTPDHLSTVEFDAEVVRALAPGGLYLANCADRPPLARTRAEVATWLAAGATDVAVSSEPALLRGRRYGNLVLAVRTAPADAPLADDAALARRLRTLPVPAHLLGGRELGEFAATAPVLRDPATGEHDDAAPSVVEDAAS